VYANWVNTLFFDTKTVMNKYDVNQILMFYSYNYLAHCAKVIHSQNMTYFYAKISGIGIGKLNKVYSNWVPILPYGVCRVGKIFSYEKNLNSKFERIYIAKFDVRYMEIKPIMINHN